MHQEAMRVLAIAVGRVVWDRTRKSRGDAASGSSRLGLSGRQQLCVGNARTLSQGTART